MSTGQIIRKFWQQWIVGNTVSFAGSFVLTIFVTNVILSTGFKNIVSSETKIGTICVIFGMSNVAVGLSQWLLLRKQVSRMSRWWILTSILG